MIKPKLSLQEFQQNIQIQKQIGQKLGYSLDNIQFSPKTKNQQKKQYLLVNQRINPLRVVQKQIEHSPKFKQLIKQIEQLQVQKKINQMMIMTKNKDQSNVAQFLNTKIREYNYLVDHKHLQNKKQKSMTSSQPKIAEEKIRDEQGTSVLQKVRNRQQQLKKTMSLLTKIRKNKQIFNIYKDYSSSLGMKNRLDYSKSSFQKSDKVSNSIDFKSEVKIKQKKQQIDVELYKKMRSIKEVNVQYPYINKRYLQNSKQLNQSLRKSRQIQQNMKQKLTQVNSLNYQKISQNNKSMILQLSKSKSELETKLDEINYPKIYENQDRIYGNAKKDKNDAILSEQKSYVLKGMKKMSPRFIRQQDSKFVTRYKIQKITKQMLQGITQEKKKPLKFHIPRMYNRKMKIPQHLNEEDKLVMGLMIEEQDDAYYWTTCRNQKINLMLKGKKHQ